MSAGNWLSPVEIVDSKVLGLGLSVADGFSGGETYLSLTMNSSFASPKFSDGNHLCKLVLEAVGNWSVDEEGCEPAFRPRANSALLWLSPRHHCQPCGKAKKRRS